MATSPKRDSKPRRTDELSVEIWLTLSLVLQRSVLAPALYSLYINDIPQTPGIRLALFIDITCIYKIDRKEGYVLRTL